jgi:hypothetical protein
VGGAPIGNGEPHTSQHPMLNYDWVNQRDYTGVGRFFKFLKNRDFGFVKYSRIKESRVLIGFKNLLKKPTVFSREENW